jgi:hypothetical protein
VEGEAVTGAGDEGEAGQGGGVEKGEQSEAHLLGQRCGSLFGPPPHSFLLSTSPRCSLLHLFRYFPFFFYFPCGLCEKEKEKVKRKKN